MGVFVLKRSSDVLKIRDSIIYNENAKTDIKIAGVGDIHLSGIVGMDDVNHISDALYTLQPDYICLLGDLVDSPDQLNNDQKVEELKTLMTNSASIAPTMVILGGHDFVADSLDGFPDVMDQTTIWDEINAMDNINVLNDKTYSDDRVFFGGYRQKRDVYYNYYLERQEDNMAYYLYILYKRYLYSDLPENLPKVFLTHSPTPVHDFEINLLLGNYDVILTGHYHNGCVPAILDDIYPKNRGLVTPRKKFFPKYARGIVKLGTGDSPYLVYSGGWVKIHECSPKILHPLDKLCNRQMDIQALRFCTL